MSVSDLYGLIDWLLKGCLTGIYQSISAKSCSIKYRQDNENSNKMNMTKRQ